MRARLVSLMPTEAAQNAGRHSLTPELLAASGARYSRSNEGLEAILGRIDHSNLDRSVDTIFRMIDYGHQSIADMAPLAIFIDGISIWLAYYLWSLASQAGGQESSTRYIRLGADQLIDPAQLGIPASQHTAWMESMERSLAHQSQLLEGWQRLAEGAPQRLRLPRELLADESPRAQRQLERMRRNFAFDRARYMLPAALATNAMFVMSARAWATLCSHLDAHPLPEATKLSVLLREEMHLATPRMLRHTRADDMLRAALRSQFEQLIAEARRGMPTALEGGNSGTAASGAYLELLAPGDATHASAASDLRHHNNRYAWVGDSLRRTAVRFGWEAMALAEIRDLNRHRTGSKYCPARPLGFYLAEEELPDVAHEERSLAPSDAVEAAKSEGCNITRQSHERLAAGDPTYVYWMLLGTQLRFEHLTTADKFIYEAELRTGSGAHFRYAAHLREVLALWYQRYPETRGLIIEGAAEPE